MRRICVLFKMCEPFQDLGTPQKLLRGCLGTLRWDRYWLACSGKLSLNALAFVRCSCCWFRAQPAQRSQPACRLNWKGCFWNPDKNLPKCCPVTMQDLSRTQGVRRIFVRTFSDVGHELRNIRLSACVDWLTNGAPAGITAEPRGIDEIPRAEEDDPDDVAMDANFVARSTAAHDPEEARQIEEYGEKGLAPADDP